MGYSRAHGLQHVLLSRLTTVSGLDSNLLWSMLAHALRRESLVHAPGADHGASSKGAPDCMRSAPAHAQTGMPMAALSVAGAQWRLSARDRGRLATELLPWALRSGMRCADLICLPYERHLQARPAWKQGHGLALR